MIDLQQHVDVYDHQTSGDTYRLTSERSHMSSDRKIEIEQKLGQLKKSRSADHAGWLVVEDKMGVLGEKGAIHFIEIVKKSSWQRNILHAQHTLQVGGEDGRTLELNAKDTSRLLGMSSKASLVRSGIGRRAAALFAEMTGVDVCVSNQAEAIAKKLHRKMLQQPYKPLFEKKSLEVDIAGSSKEPVPVQGASFAVDSDFAARLKTLGLYVPKGLPPTVTSKEDYLDLLQKLKESNAHSKVHAPRDGTALMPQEALFLTHFERIRQNNLSLLESRILHADSALQSGAFSPAASVQRVTPEVLIQHLKGNEGGSRSSKGEWERALDTIRTLLSFVEGDSETDESRKKEAKVNRLQTTLEESMSQGRDISYQQASKNEQIPFLPDDKPYGNIFSLFELLKKDPLEPVRATRSAKHARGPSTEDKKSKEAARREVFAARIAVLIVALPVREQRIALYQILKERPKEAIDEGLLPEEQPEAVKMLLEQLETQYKAYVGLTPVPVQFQSILPR